MRRILSLILTLVSVVILLGGCQNKSQQQSRQSSNATAVVNQPSTAAATPDDGVRRISVEELRAALQEDRAVILDVRGSVEYDMGHIKGARFLPLGEIPQRAAELPRGKLIVTYCACKHEGLSGNAVRELNKQGIENASALMGGLDAWTAAGLPTEKTSDNQ